MLQKQEPVSPITEKNFKSDCQVIKLKSDLIQIIKRHYKLSEVSQRQLAALVPGLSQDRVSKIFQKLFEKEATKEEITGFNKSVQTVWDSIKATQPVHPGSVIPQSFEMTTATSKFWVHGNAIASISSRTEAVRKDDKSMLKFIKSEIKENNSSIEIDEYVPFSYRSGPRNFVPIYWSAKNIVKTILIEIGLNPIDGTICRTTVTSSSTPILVNTELSLDNYSTISKETPIFDISGWKQSEFSKDNFKEEQCNMKSIIGKNFVTFWLSEEAPVKNIYDIGNLLLHFNLENELIKIDFINLNDEDLKKIKKALKP